MVFLLQTAFLPREEVFRAFYFLIIFLEQYDELSNLEHYDLLSELFEQEGYENQYIEFSLERDSVHSSRKNWVDSRFGDYGERLTFDDFLEAWVEELSYYDSGVPSHGKDTENDDLIDSDWNSLHTFGFIIQTAFLQVDRFLDENGLRGTVEEIKQRKWVLRLALTLFMLWFYIKNTG